MVDNSLAEKVWPKKSFGRKKNLAENHTEHPSFDQLFKIHLIFHFQNAGIVKSWHPDTIFRISKIPDYIRIPFVRNCQIKHAVELLRNQLGLFGAFYARFLILKNPKLIQISTLDIGNWSICRNLLTLNSS